MSSTSSKNTVPIVSMSYSNLRFIRVDGAGDVTLEMAYKDMSVAQLKREVTAKLRRPGCLWEDLNLYHLGVVMRNDQSLQHYNLHDTAIIRYSLETHTLPRSTTISIASPTHDLFIFDSCLTSKFCEDGIRTILSLDIEQSRTLLGMPSARMFVDVVLKRRGMGVGVR